MHALLSFIEKHSLGLSQVLCVVVVFWVAWPALRQPRMEEDDFRYLHAVQQLSADESAGLVEAATVENRWDHLWFMEEEGRIRFFRPTVVISYGIDWLIWGDRYAFGLTLTNVLVHLGCCLLVAFLLHRWLGSGLPAIMATVLFAGLWSHGECIWYIAGRTDSLAALGFLSAFALHTSQRRAVRWWAVLCFAFGLFTKELVIAAPLLFLAHDCWVEHRKPRWTRYAVYAATAAAVILIKHVALGGVQSDFVYPYLISPLRPDFMEHLWLQARSYSANLLLAQWTAPFADRTVVAAMSHLAGIGLLFGLLLVCIILLRRDGRLWLLLMLGGVTWLPVSFVYLSERYLYLPSVAVVGILGLLVATRPVRWSHTLAVVLGIYAIFHTVKLHAKHTEICDQPGSVREMDVQLAPVRGEIEKGGRLLLVNLPGTFLRAQFAQETFRVLLDDPELTVQVLTMMPGQNGTILRPGDAPPAMGSGAAVEQAVDATLMVKGPPGQRVQEYGWFPFDWSSLAPGREHVARGLKAAILSGDEQGAMAIAFTLPECRDRFQVLIWDAAPDAALHPWHRRTGARIRLLTL